MANYPTSISTDANLYIAVNNKRTQLNGAITNSDTTITVDSTTGFPASGLISIENEVIAYTSLNATQFLTCTRGFDGTIAASHVDDSFVSLRVVAAHHNNLKDEVIAVETALGTNLSNVVQTTGTQTISGVKTFDTQLIGKGTATNDSAAAGYIGEHVSSTVGSTAAPASNVVGDATSISLTAGDWDICGALNWNPTSDTTRLLIGISTTSGNSFTGLVLGQSRFQINYTTATVLVVFGQAIPPFRVSLSGTTTYYLKFYTLYSTGSPVIDGGTISARRAR